MEAYNENTPEEGFEIYDKVWVIENNHPIEKIVYSVTYEMDFAKTGIRFAVGLVNGILGAGIYPNAPMVYDLINIFKTKQELINSL